MNVVLPSPLVEELPRLTAGALKTYVTLSYLKKTQKPYPTQDDIAAYSKSCVRSVFVYLEELEQAGLIEKRRLGPGMLTDYRLLEEPAYGA
jgi:Mn-dependent DtxR family transcriptional regulator